MFLIFLVLHSLRVLDFFLILYSSFLNFSPIFSVFKKWLFYQYFKIILEPGGAVALASALFKKIDIKNKTVVIIASGGNVDPEIFEKSLKTSI